jgi:cardiolipin synthase
MPSEILFLAVPFLTHPAFVVLAVVAVLIVLLLVVLILFEPGLEYRVVVQESRTDSDEFLHQVGALADAQVQRLVSVEVLTDGGTFYDAELAAIAAARHSVNLEAYIFERSEIGGRVLAALAKRAKAGVQVRLVLDAVGSFRTGSGCFDDLRAAGGQITWYHPLRWYNFKRLNNRTHRNLLIIDGRVGFLGGAGFADHWLRTTPKEPCWRDSMFRVEGPLVAGLQSAFAENWLEASGEILFGDEHFPVDLATSDKDSAGGQPGLVVNSAPSAGRATRGRILFQTLLAASRQSIHITTPYFIPDRSARAELIRAARERRVAVKVLTAGPCCDHLLARRLGRRHYGELLLGGVEICEYQPAMMHAKCLVVDGLWAVVGSTNFDNRSFGHNDEINLASRDAQLAARLDEDFARDLARSRPITYEEWRRRPFTERIQEVLAGLLQRQA